MILDVDVGNTFIKWRVKCRAAGHGDQLFGSFYTHDLAQHMRADWSGLSVGRVRLACVAGEPVREQILSWFEMRHISVEVAVTGARVGRLVNSYADPGLLGVDRWLAMLAACHEESEACCVVDCGSAITVDYVDRKGRHQGGYIIPGLRLMRRGLLQNTQQVRVDRPLQGFQTTPGKSTAEAVDHGINLVFEAFCGHVVQSCSDRLLVTGGDGRLFVERSGAGEYRSDLVLDGLALALP